MLIGIFWAELSVVCWSTIFPAVSLVMKRGNVDPYTLSSLRFLIAGIVMLACLAGRGCGAVFPAMTKKGWLCMIGCGGFAALMSISLFCAQQTELPVVNAALLESEAPLLIFLLGIVFLRNKPISLQFFGLLFGFIGSLFCSQGC